MRAILIERQGGPVASNIRTSANWADAPADPAPGEARLRTLASALNHMDLWVGLGIPGVELTYPRVSGCDACAEVTAVGPEVSDEWLGRRVILNAALAQPNRAEPDAPTGATLAPEYRLIGEHSHGTHRESFCAPVENLVPVGQDADPFEAAAFGLVTLTAYSMMVTKGRLRPGQTVLITGIGGGVALAALSIAQWMGCPVCVTSRHQWKLDRARGLGADALVLDQGQDWSKEVRAWTGKRGVDMAVDSVGAPTHLNCIKSLARGGGYVTPGNTAGPRAPTDLARLFWNQLRVLGSTMGTNDEMRETAALFRAGHLRATIDSVHAWTDAPRAWQRIEAGEQFGKVVIDWES
ncbi:MAG TPA: alcohol dehydrogenase [Phycisphaerales bacterium]|nr:alcohol dehydrogenase [Phycisphaerales bacterium]